MNSPLAKLTNTWFYASPHIFLRLLQIFVKGDSIVLLPTVLGILLTSIWSIRFMWVLIGVYLAIRFLGEMVYWLLQQFGDKRYRPYDYGLKQLDNNAIYIVYQTWAIMMTVLGIGILLWGLFFY